MSNKKRFDAVLSTLLDPSNSLRELAENSGFDPFKFYQGAELSGLDLSRQDLTGLNFDRANFENSCLDDVKFEVGAFNGAEIDRKYSDKKDQYEFFIDDVFSASRFGLYFFARFRTQSLELAIEKTQLYYSEFSNLAAINPQTLRKARRAEIVAGDTAISICTGLLEAWENVEFDDLLSDETELRQPFIQIVDLSPKGDFIHISRRDFRDVFRPKIIEEQENGPVSPSPFRTSFAIEKWYRNNEYLIF